VGSGELDAMINDSRGEAQVVRSSSAVANSIAQTTFIKTKPRGRELNKGDEGDG
jgi:hypothetical protein